MTLKDIFIQIDTIPKPKVAAKSISANLNEICYIYEQSLVGLQALKDYLDVNSKISSTDLWSVLVRLRKIYCDIGTWDEVSEFYIEVTKEMATGRKQYNCSDICMGFLLNKNIVILNRTIFNVKRSKLAVRESVK